MSDTLYIQTYLIRSMIRVPMPAVRTTVATKVEITIVTVTPTDSGAGSSVGCGVAVTFVPWTLYSTLVPNALAISLLVYSSASTSFTMDSVKKW